jgi:thiosulfate dehydrogenase (quinone) large subunit
VLLPLRLFLGATFTFAGLQKLADPRFFDSRSSASIQAQLQAAAARSPISGALSTLQHHAVAVGLAIAFAELAVGIGTLLGLYARAAAVGGIALAVGFLFSVSWHSSPYYLGSDVVFLFAWTPLAIGGAGGVLALDALTQKPTPSGEQVDRRVVLQRGTTAIVAGGVTLVVAGVTAALGRVVGGSRRPLLAQPSPPAPTTSTTSGPPTAATTGLPSTTAPVGTALGPATNVPVGGAKLLEDPIRFQPLWVLQREAGQFVAVSALCTHKGCVVGYSASSRTFLCPCHGASFSTSGEVLGGPAPYPLFTLAVHEGPDGLLYLS